MTRFSIKQLFGYSVAILLQKFSAFLVLPLVSSSLSVADFGLANQFIYIGGLYILFVMVGLDESVAKRCFTSERIDVKYLTGGFLLLTINSFVFMLVVIFFGDLLYGLLTGSQDVKLVVLSVIIVCLSPFHLTYLKILRLTNRSGEFFLLTCFSVTIQVSMLIMLVVVFKLGVFGYLLAFAITIFTNVVYVFVSSWGKLSLGEIKRPDLIMLLKYGAKVAPHTISTWGLMGFTVVFIGKYMGSEASAAFVTMNYLPMIASVASYAFFYTYQPWLYTNLRNASPASLYVNKIVLFLASFIVLLLGLYVVSGWLYNLIFGVRYMLDDRVLLCLLFACFFQFAGSLFTYFLYYFEGATKYVSITTILGVLTNVAIFVWLVPYFGLLGAAFSFMVAQLVTWILRMALAIRALNGSPLINRVSAKVL